MTFEDRDYLATHIRGDRMMDSYGAQPFRGLFVSGSGDGASVGGDWRNR